MFAPPGSVLEPIEGGAVCAHPENPVKNTKTPNPATTRIHYLLQIGHEKTIRPLISRGNRLRSGRSSTQDFARNTTLERAIPPDLQEISRVPISGRSGERDSLG